MAFDTNSTCICNCLNLHHVSFDHSRESIAEPLKTRLGCGQSCELTEVLNLESISDKIGKVFMPAGDMQKRRYLIFARGRDHQDRGLDSFGLIVDIKGVEICC